MKFDKKYISRKFTFILILFWIFAALIVARMLKTMIFDKEECMKMRTVLYEREGKTYNGKRGDILSADGMILSSSLPKHNIYIDFLSGLTNPQKYTENPDSLSKADSTLLALKDSMFYSNLDTICRGLARICPTKTAEQYKDHLLKGRKSCARHYEICQGVNLNHIQYNQIIDLPYFNWTKDSKTKYTVGLVFRDRTSREKPFGDLARRTIGELFGVNSDSAKSGQPYAGLEAGFDEVLRGRTGIKHFRRIGSSFLPHVDSLASDGSDIVTTLDINMQEICENALRQKLTDIKADWGIVILEEAKTGDIKAQVNLAKTPSGEYVEKYNYAITALQEPGSTFKTSSIMVALDDGAINITDKVNTGGGVYKMHGSSMRDHNWTRGGYGTIDVPHTLIYSSNIGVSLLIDQHYSKDPQKFIDGLYRVGIVDSFNLPFLKAPHPIVRNPESKYWSAADLPWMSIGYSIQIPPIYLVNFYNGIANNGRLMQPRYVKAIQRHGEVVEELPPVVLRERMCSEQTLKNIRQALFDVVNSKDGTGKQARCQRFNASGKTGTAQISKGAAGYTSGTRQHYVSFCGFFPSEDPKYTCLVGIHISGGHASGGGMAGPVFSQIAENVYAHSTCNFKENEEVEDVKWEKDPLPKGTKRSPLPDLTGMGARDAVYEVERRGMKAVVTGKGKVKSQSVPAGTQCTRGTVVKLELK